MDGRDIKSALTLPRLRRQLGVVQQEPVLFEGTLAENIAYGDNGRQVTTQEITAAAKAANIHSFIVSLPDVSSSQCMTMIVNIGLSVLDNNIFIIFSDIFYQCKR